MSFFLVLFRDIKTSSIYVQWEDTFFHLITKSELRLEAEKKLRGMPGDRIKDCLEKLQDEGKVKKDAKCVQTRDCCYDPPISHDPSASLDSLSEDLLFEAVGLISGFAESYV